MENTKAKSLVMVVVIVLLAVCLGVVVWKYVGITSANNPSATQGQNLNSEITSLKATIETKDTQIDSLKSEVESKDKEIATLKNENEQLKKSEDTNVQVVTKNKCVLFDSKKLKNNSKYVTSKVALYPVSVLYFDENGESATYTIKISDNGEVVVNYKSKTYTVKGFTKKVIELYAISDDQTATEAGIAVMEDGTIEQIYFDGNNFKTRGTIGGVNDVIKFIYVSVNGQRKAAAVQANGDTVVLSGLKNYYNPGV